MTPKDGRILRTLVRHTLSGFKNAGSFSIDYQFMAPLLVSLFTHPVAVSVIHVVSAVAYANGMVLGQVKTDAK